MVETKIVDAADIARALQTTVRSVSRWQAAGSAPRRDSEERLLELNAVVRLLGDVMQPDAGRLWLRSPHPELDYEKPLDLIAAGRYREVVAELLALAEGVTG
jgi:putative toxin-antitoxin system antitoxin component (TIGR02293 family)